MLSGGPFRDQRRKGLGVLELSLPRPAPHLDRTPTANLIEREPFITSNLMNEPIKVMSDNEAYRMQLMNELIAHNTLPDTIATRLTAWTIEARASLAPNTLRAYSNDSRAFADWCRTQGLSSLPATAVTVAAYLRAESATKSTATIRRRAATIARMHKAAGVSNPCDHEFVKLALKGISKTNGTDQCQAAPLNERDTVIIGAHTGTTLKDVRDIALLLVGRDLLARASELIALDVADIEWGESCALVRVRRRKTSTVAQTCYIGEDAATALRAWLARAEIDEGMVFRSVTSGGNLAASSIGTRDVRRILKSMAVRAGLAHAAGVSGHSLRVGMCQDLVAADLDIAAVMQAGGWASPTMVSRYCAKLSARRGAVARFHSR